MKTLGIIKLEYGIEFVDFLENASDSLLEYAEKMKERGRVCYPRWGSIAGYDRILDTVVRGTTLSQGEAVAALMCYAEEDGSDISFVDIEPVLGLDPSVYESIKDVSPFSEKMPTIENMISFSKEGIKKGWSDVIDYSKDMKRFCKLPKTKREAKRLHWLSDTYGLTIHKLIMDPILKESWMHLSNEVLISRHYDIPVSLVKLSKVEREPYVHFSILQHLKNEIDAKYWDGEMNMDSLLKAGVKYTTIAEGLPKAETIEYVKHIGELMKQDLNHLLQLLDTTLLDARESSCYVHWKLDPMFQSVASPVFQYRNVWSSLTYYTTDYYILEWCVEHIDKLAQTREEHGPGGQVATFHNHRIVRYMRREFLTNGKKTAWRKVWKACEEQVKIEMAEQLKINCELPKLPITSSMPGVTQLICTDELKLEGNKMNHCVASYAPKCGAGESYIVHIDDGTQLGCTAEINPPNPKIGKTGWSVAQVKGHSNCRSERGELIANKFVESLPLKYASK